MLTKYAPFVFAKGIDSINRLALDILSETKCDDLLDIGCGDGILTMEFAKACGARNVTGIEIEPSAIAKAEKSGIQCIKADLNANWNIPPESYDVIISSQNIEHLYNTRIYLQQAYSALRKGGRIVVITENLASWANIGALMLGWEPFSATNLCGLSIGNPLIWHKDLPKDLSGPDYTTSPGSHVKVFSYCALKDLLSACGFTDVRMHTRGYFPLFGGLSNLMCSIDKRHGHFLLGTARKP